MERKKSTTAIWCKTWKIILEPFDNNSLFFSVCISDMAVGLRVNVTVPKAVTSGSNVTIVCDHDLDSDNVYTVKWYKGGHEFFRYTPREFPALKLFWLPGIKVDVSIK